VAKLYLIPTSLNPQAQNKVLLPEQLRQIQSLKYFIVETAKIGRAHLKLLELNTPLPQLNILELNKHKHDYKTLIKPLLQGNDLGLISDCGCPAIADPGSHLISLAHDLGFNLVPLIGPSSILLSLMASGLNGQKFSFLGYLPLDPNQRKNSLLQLEQEIICTQTTYIFIETPFRNNILIDSITKLLNPKLRLCIASNLMGAQQIILTKSIAAWKENMPNLHKQEAIFLLGA
jgi:16S rRNA (cytidine1402-2'-O)-methyltransferase